MGNEATGNIRYSGHTSLFFIQAKLQCYTHTSVSIAVFLCITEYIKMIFLSFWNKTHPCVSTRFCKKSKRSKEFHHNKTAEKHCHRLLKLDPIIRHHCTPNSRLKNKKHAFVFAQIIMVFTRVNCVVDINTSVSAEFLSIRHEMRNN